MENILLKRDLPLTYVSLITYGGPLIEENNQKGFTHFLEHLIYRQNSIKGFIWENLGGRIGFCTQRETFRAQLTFESEKIDYAIESLFDAIYNFEVNEEIIEEEKKIIMDENRAQKSSPNYILAESFYNIAFPNSYLSRDVGGLDYIQEVNTDSIKKFHSSFLDYFNPTLLSIGNDIPITKMNIPLPKCIPNFEINLSKSGGSIEKNINSNRSYFMVGVSCKGYSTGIRRESLSLLYSLFRLGRFTDLQKQLHYQYGLYFLDFDMRVYNSAGTIFFQGSGPTQSIINVEEYLRKFWECIPEFIKEEDFSLAKKAYIFSLKDEFGNVNLQSVRQSKTSFWGYKLKKMEEIIDYKYSEFILDLQSNIISEPISVLLKGR